MLFSIKGTLKLISLFSCLRVLVAELLPAFSVSVCKPLAMVEAMC
jgi:hypothetical protein